MKDLLEKAKTSFDERKNNPQLRQQFLIDAGILNDNLEYVKWFETPTQGKPLMKIIDLLDYKAIISYNKEKHYPLMITLHDKAMTKELYVGSHITIDQLCFQLHLQLLDYKECYLNPVKTLLLVEEVRNTLDLWLYSEE